MVKTVVFIPDLPNPEISLYLPIVGSDVVHLYSLLLPKKADYSQSIIPDSKHEVLASGLDVPAALIGSGEWVEPASHQRHTHTKLI